MEKTDERFANMWVYSLSWFLISIDESFVKADNPSSMSSTTAIDLDPSVIEQDTSTFSYQPLIMSQLEDFDFFNTLDWSFDENSSSSWS